MTKIIALVLAGLVLAGCAQHTEAAKPVAASHVVTPTGELRVLAHHKAHASVKAMKRHAKATEKRKAAARRAREAAQAAARQDQGSGGPGPDTPQERACVGHESEYPCSVIEQRDVGDHHVPTFAERCPSGAATSAACGREVYGDGPTSGERQAQWMRDHPNG